MNKWQALLTADRKPGLYRLPPRTSVVVVKSAVEPAGWRVFSMDGAKVSDKASFLSTAAAAMHFPDYFGKNWDAFEDSLNDLQWAPAKGYILLFSHAGQFARSADWKMAVTILRDATRKWQKLGTPMYVLIGGAPDTFPEF